MTLFSSPESQAPHLIEIQIFTKLTAWRLIFATLLSAILLHSQVLMGVRDIVSWAICGEREQRFCAIRIKL
jgi:hypothetical protein